MVLVEFRFHSTLVVFLLRIVHCDKLAFSSTSRPFPVSLSKGTLNLKDVLTIFIPWRLTARQAEIAKSYATVTVNEEVSRFEISVQQICGVDEIESAERVVHHGNNVILLQNGSPVHRIEYLFQVRLDVFHDHEDLLETSQINVLIIRQLFLQNVFARHRLKPSIG